MVQGRFEEAENGDKSLMMCEREREASGNFSLRRVHLFGLPPLLKMRRNLRVRAASSDEDSQIPRPAARAAAARAPGRAPIALDDDDAAPTSFSWRRPGAVASSAALGVDVSAPSAVTPAASDYSASALAALRAAQTYATAQPQNAVSVDVEMLEVLDASEEAEAASRDAALATEARAQRDAARAGRAIDAPLHIPLRSGNPREVVRQTGAGGDVDAAWEASVLARGRSTVRAGAGAGNVAVDDGSDFADAAQHASARSVALTERGVGAAARADSEAEQNVVGNVPRGPTLREFVSLAKARADAAEAEAAETSAAVLRAEQDLAAATAALPALASRVDAAAPSAELFHVLARSARAVAMLFSEKTSSIEQVEATAEASWAALVRPTADAASDDDGYEGGSGGGGPSLSVWRMALCGDADGRTALLCAPDAPARAGCAGALHSATLDYADLDSVLSSVVDARDIAAASSASVLAAAGALILADAPEHVASARAFLRSFSTWKAGVGVSPSAAAAYAASFAPAALLTVTSAYLRIELSAWAPLVARPERLAAPACTELASADSLRAALELGDTPLAPLAADAPNDAAVRHAEAASSDAAVVPTLVSRVAAPALARMLRAGALDARNPRALVNAVAAIADVASFEPDAHALDDVHRAFAAALTAEAAAIGGDVGGGSGDTTLTPRKLRAALRALRLLRFSAHCADGALPIPIARDVVGCVIAQALAPIVSAAPHGAPRGGILAAALLAFPESVWSSARPAEFANGVFELGSAARLAADGSGDGDWVRVCRELGGRATGIACVR